MRLEPNRSGQCIACGRFQRGFLLVTAVVLIVVAALVLSAMVFFSVVASQSAATNLGSKQAFFIAESGIERAIRGFWREGTACGALNYANNLGTGSFSTNGTLYAPSPVTTLSANVGVADTVIPVASTSGYAPFGRITVESEEINYAGIGTSAATCAPFASPCLTDAERGAGGSVAAAHMVGAAVLQNQCNITSVGTVSTASRTVAAVVPTGVIALDAVSSSTRNGAVVSWSHTVGGADRILMVGVMIRNNTNQTVTSVTYGAASLSQVSGSAVNNGNNVRVEWWYLPNPTVGTANIRVSLSGNARVVVGGISLTGVEQTNPIDAVGTNTGSCVLCSATPTANVTTLSDNDWVIDAVAWRQTTNTATPGAGQTQQWLRTSGGGRNNGVGGAGSTFGPQTPAGARTMGWTLGSGLFHNWAVSAIAIKPAGGGRILYWREIFP